MKPWTCGNLAYIPPGEFIGAGLWQLFKGIESPYKSVLKLLLTEVYASEHPRVHCLSLRFKQAVFANRLDLDELDPYVVVYRRIEEYLIARSEPERLDHLEKWWDELPNEWKDVFLQTDFYSTKDPQEDLHRLVELKSNQFCGCWRK